MNAGPVSFLGAEPEDTRSHCPFGCEFAETNEEDCLGNPHPTCGYCLWARGVVRCA